MKRTSTHYLGQMGSPDGCPFFLTLPSGLQPPCEHFRAERRGGPSSPRMPRPLMIIRKRRTTRTPRWATCDASSSGPWSCGTLALFGQYGSSGVGALLNGRASDSEFLIPDFLESLTPWPLGLAFRCFDVLTFRLFLPAYRLPTCQRASNAPRTPPALSLRLLV